MKGGLWFFFWVGIFFPSCRTQAQGVRDSLNFVESAGIEAGMRMTTNLLFHYKIRQVDKGSGDVIAKILNDTVLLVKAGKVNFLPTNLSVYTADGKLHGFQVRYVAEPAHAWIQLEGPVSRRGIITQDSLEYYGGIVAAAPTGKHGLRDRRYQLCWELRGLFARSNLLFFSLRLSNHSPVDYQPGSFRFVIYDKKRVRRTATQERELIPVYIRGDMESIAVDSDRVWVFALPVFTVSVNRRLRIALSEKNGGGRDLWINMTSRRMLEAKRIE